LLKANCPSKRAAFSPTPMAFEEELEAFDDDENEADEGVVPGLR
jgi:hypothetical protein